MRRPATLKPVHKSAAFAALLSGALLCAVAPSAHAASVATWEKVAQCESSGNWSIDTGNGYYGGLQISSSTWAAYGGTAYAPEANLATEEQQILVAEKILAAQGQNAWPTCGPAANLAADTANPYPSGPSTPPAAPRPARVAAGDFNGDGKLDVVGIDANSNMQFYPGDGAGDVSGPGVPMLGTTGLWANFKAIASGDFNGDGKADVAGIDANNNMMLYTGDGAGHLTGGSNMMPGTNGLWANFKAITAGDFMGTGHVGIAGIDANNNLMFYPGDGAGHLGAGIPMLGTNGAWVNFKAITAGDFTGTGKLGIAGIDANNNLMFYAGDGAGHVSGGTPMLGTNGLWAGFHAVMAGDFTGTGKLGIAGIDANNNLKFYPGDGAGHVSGGTQMLAGNGLWAGF
ncbi:transglycosylase family protein [Kitasatospora sp. NPDC052896]|uniref:transglycosylase family protein n=1 Tax=Kitasatospora sp. NPDC052896 TaxID=3364061 RepID=UPI0037C7208D